MMKNLKLFSALIAVIFVICMLPGIALAENNTSGVPDATPPKTPAPMSDETEKANDPATDTEETAEAEEIIDAEAAAEEPVDDAAPVVVNDGETCFTDGVVFNNGGTVYNNGGVVFNNGGVVYNNNGVCYNNGGTCYNNNGVVYDNGGTVFNNGGEVISTAAEDSAEEAEPMEADEATDETDADTESENVDDAEAVEETEDEVSIKEEVDELAETDVSEGEENAVLDAPVFSLLSGTFSESHEIELSAAEGARIYYTLDGSDPDENSKLYKYRFPVSKSTVVKAIAVMDGFENSEIACQEYAFVEISAPKFAAVEEDYTQPEAKPIVIENKGAVNAVVRAVELDETGAQYFELNTTDGGSIGTESTDDSTWTIRPAAKLDVGMYRANVIFTFDSGDTQSVHVTIKVSKTAV